MQTSAVPLMLSIPNPHHSTRTMCRDCVGRWPPMRAVTERQDQWVLLGTARAALLWLCSPSSCLLISASPLTTFHQLSVLRCLKDLYVLWLDLAGSWFWWVTFQFFSLSLKEQVDSKVWNAYSERSDNKRVIGASTKISIFMFVKYF